MKNHGNHLAARKSAANGENLKMRKASKLGISSEISGVVSGNGEETMAKKRKMAKNLANRSET
jgi:hypothetical protein